MKTALRWAYRVALWIVVLAALGALAVGVLIPRLAGATTYTILTGSMQPDLRPGTLVVVRPVAPAQIAVGDVITFQLQSGDPTVATHRVYAQGINNHTGEYLFRTKGDANNAPDPGWVRAVQVKGRVWYAVPWLGRVNDLLTGRGRQWAVSGAALALLGYAGYMVASAFRDRRRARRSGGHDAEAAVEAAEPAQPADAVDAARHRKKVTM